MSKEQQAQAQPQVAIPLPKAKKNLVQIGCICMMLSVAMYGLVFATLTAPILKNVDAMGYVGLFSIVGAIGVSIMTPIGGKLGDLIGRRNIVVIPGIICAIAGFGFAFVRSLIPLMILRLVVSLAQGAFTAAPYIIAGLINERKDVPKAMGMLATAIAVGGFGGSIIAGILTDMGMLTVAIIMPAIPLIIGIVLIGMNMPNQKREGKVTIDVPGMIALIIALCGILLALNFGSSVGWTSPAIIAGFVIGIIALIALVKIENKASEPLIPMKLFKNKNYTILLIVGFICYFYQNAMNGICTDWRNAGNGSTYKCRRSSSDATYNYYYYSSDHRRCLGWKESSQCMESYGNCYRFGSYSDGSDGSNDKFRCFNHDLLRSFGDYRYCRKFSCRIYYTYSTGHVSSGRYGSWNLACKLCKLSCRNNCSSSICSSI